MSFYHTGKYACSNNNCKYVVDRSIYYKGTLCADCVKILNLEHVQAVRCEKCGAIHLLRKKMSKDEPKYVAIGLCYWCKERMIEDLKISNKSSESYQYNSQEFAKNVIDKLKDNNGTI